MLKLYNTLSRKLEVFKPINEKEVTIYTCGATIYSYVHLGNLKSALTADLLKRYLKYKGYKVKHVMNVTDVDDKTIRDSQKEGKSLKEFTDFYAKAYIEDLNKLNFQMPDFMPRPTEEIKEMVKIIKILLEKKIAYKTENGDIYFSIAKFKNYGKIANLDLKQLKKNADGRLNAKDEYEKDDARDFALWKAYEEKDGDVYWDTEIGKGRPGWHVECSAMSSKYLGQPFDIHTGGVDLIFPHHTNEIAQSEAAYGKKLCNYWVHNEFLNVNGEKMSKSLGNFYTLKDLLSKGYSSNAIRYELISIHYRQKMDFREKNMEDVEGILNKFKELFIKLDNVKGEKNNKNLTLIIEKAEKDFEDAMDDDLNISVALAAVFGFVKECNKLLLTIGIDDAGKIRKTLLKFDSVLGVMNFEREEIPKRIIELAEKRLKAKKEKNWAEADKIREEIKEKGYTIDDTKEGYLLKKD
jgi:cysteinyl-tRNA synthetase